MVGVIVQCRLSSTRLPGKALLPLGGRPILAWVLSAMGSVPADAHLVATDAASLPELAPIAEAAGWDIIAGPLEDVLERFCLAIEYLNLDNPAIVRATGDNPFLFYEAAASSVTAFLESGADYFTYTGLPHGSGVEVLSAASLLRARRSPGTTAYDREHVGPALYKHPDEYRCVFEPYPALPSTPTLRYLQPQTYATYDPKHTLPTTPNIRYLRPQTYATYDPKHTLPRTPNMRTTVDTPADYRRAQRMVHIIGGGADTGCAPTPPYTQEQILAALEAPAITHPVLLVPSLQQGRGTGHLRRCLSLAANLGVDILVPPEATLAEAPTLIAEAHLAAHQIVTSGAPCCAPTDTRRGAASPECNTTGVQRPTACGGTVDYTLIVTDTFALTLDQAQILSRLAPLAALDEGSEHTDYCDYLLDLIPGTAWGKNNHLVNDSRPDLLPLPAHRRTAPAAIREVLVCFGGEDPAQLTPRAARAAAQCGYNVTAICPSSASVSGSAPEALEGHITWVPAIPNLREELHRYDAVITHYGFTAWEACAAGCVTVLLGTTPLHLALARKYAFPALSPRRLNPTNLQRVLGTATIGTNNYSPLPHPPSAGLPALIQRLAKGSRLPCPLCGKTHPENAAAVVVRTPARTFRRCGACGLVYLAWAADGDTSSYDAAYFFDDYKAQYGKTYLEDFEKIKAMGRRRIALITKLLNKTRPSAPEVPGAKRAGHVPRLLDVGCAYGPFLAAAHDAGWDVTGTDVNREAIDYVKNTLCFPAFCGDFSTFSSPSSTPNASYDAVTMWFVIEHFTDLRPALETVRRMLKPGGIFAVSAPSGAGISARHDPKAFFSASPRDHASIWEPATVTAVLAKQGFRVLRIVSTGHHPERFASPLPTALLAAASRLFRLGDTFEVYAALS